MVLVVGVQFTLSSYQSIGHFSLEHAPNPDDFKEADLDLLEETAIFLNYRHAAYHLPTNQSVRTLFLNDSAEHGGEVSYTQVDRYIFSDNEALFTSIDFVGWVYKYLVARQENNSTMEQFAHDVLINMTCGLAHLMKVPNGGLGREYSGILGRGWAAPDHQEIAPMYFQEHNRHFNGTGIYSDYRWRGYTSNDEFGGYYLFLALSTKYLMHIPFIQERVSLIVDQLCYNMLKTNFQGIHGTGATTGIDQKTRMFNGGFWAPLLLKMGALHFPEKYQETYLHYVANEMSYLSAVEGGLQETFANYYAFNFGHCVVFSFLLLEDPSTEIWQRFYEGYYNSLWQFTRYHRNAWFNAIFLMLFFEADLTSADISPDDNLTIISNDIKDQLQRFAETHVPNVRYEIGEELPEGYELVYPVKDFVDNLGLDEDLQNFMGIREDEAFLNKPLTVDYYGQTLWSWERNPYLYRPTRHENLLYEYPGSTFFVPYWMMRYSGFLEGGS